VVEAGQLDPALRSRLERVDAAGAPPVAGRLTAMTLRTVRAEIDAPADGLVVVGELYYRRGWTATVDGAEVPIVAVNGWARGVPVGPGHHVIEMTFSATYVICGDLIRRLPAWLVIVMAAAAGAGMMRVAVAIDGAAVLTTSTPTSVRQRGRRPGPAPGVAGQPAQRPDRARVGREIDRARPGHRR
jgi:hypothetical protein